MADGSRFLLAAPADSHDAFALLGEALRSRGYSTDSLAPASPEQLAQVLRTGKIHVLVLYAKLPDATELATLTDLRRKFPAVDWVLAWHSHSPHWAEVVVKSQARGYIDCDVPRNFGQAIDTIAAGDLWFPRWLVHELYFRLLAAVRDARFDVTHSLGEFAAALTQREAEALELMRQGLTNKEIAWRLKVSVNTVKKHLKNAFDKRGLHSRRQGLV